MKTVLQRRGFTLIEVNLAIGIMATGVLVMCILYALGYRENRQSIEDVASSALAEAFFAPLVQGLSATNMTWSSWLKLGDKSKNGFAEFSDGVWPSEGWASYVNGGPGDSYSLSTLDPDSYYEKAISLMPPPYNGKKPEKIPDGYSYGFVLTRHGAVVQLAFRCSRRKNMLMSQPIFVTEVHFQGEEFQ